MSTKHRTSTTDDFGPSQGRLSRFINDHIIVFLIGPAVLIIAGVFIYPVLHMFWQSLHITQGPIHRFAPLYNYKRLLQSASFWNSLKVSFIYSFGSLAMSLLAGLSIALAINKLESKFSRNLYATTILISWAVPLVIAALLWKWVLAAGEFGLLNSVLLDLGLIESPIAYLARQRTALFAVTFVDAWVRTPFAMIVLLAGLQSIPQHMYDAALVDGATMFQTFRRITLPFLKPFIAIAALINWMFSFRAFSVVFPMTGGGPGQATELISLFIFKNGIALFNFGYGAAAAVVILAITLVVASYYVSVIMENLEEED